MPDRWLVQDRNPTYGPAWRVFDSLTYHAFWASAKADAEWLADKLNQLKEKSNG